VLSGRLVYDGEPVGVRQGLSVLHIFEPGWQTYEPINVIVKQDGTFSSLLFQGHYNLVPIAGTGPFIVHDTDTVNVAITASLTTIDIPVVPYFITSNEQIKKEGSTLTTVFNIEKIVQTASLDKVGVFIGETMLVDDKFYIKKMEVDEAVIGNDIASPIVVPLTINDIKEQTVYIRIGVKAKESSEYLFTQVQKIEVH